MERNAERDLNRLQGDLFERVVSVLRDLGTNPRPPGCRKLAGSKSDWRIRIGDYRAVYEIDDEVEVVRVMRIRHRREVYR